jgi:hypothetical protein
LFSYDVVLEVEIIGERSADRKMPGIRATYYSYLAQVTDLISYTRLADGNTDYVFEDLVGENIYLTYAYINGATVDVGEKYVVVGYYGFHAVEGIMAPEEKLTVRTHLFAWNGRPSVFSYAGSTYFITPNDYVIELGDKSPEFSHTGETAEMFTDKILTVSEEMSWIIPSKDEEREIPTQSDRPLEETVNPIGEATNDVTSGVTTDEEDND